ncbi:MAG: adenylate/guanylate cyclase domain-containing protein [Solirubrobacteraceae bacterium]
MSINDVASAVGVSAGTLRRWAREGVLPEYAGEWNATALANARLVARLRQRGYTLARIRAATVEGRLAFGRVVELFDRSQSSPLLTFRQAARRSRLDLDTVAQVAAALGFVTAEKLDETALEVLSYVATGLRSGMPAAAMLQIVRVYSQAIAQIADAEVRLVHLYLHEPLMRSGGTPQELAAEIHAVAESLLPLSTQLLERLHHRLLLEYIEQDVVGHMEAELPEADDHVGRMLVAIAFVDLAGYTELTDREGDLHALEVVERFLAAVNSTLPGDARVVKTIGDEVMIVAADPTTLASWAIELCELLSRTGPSARAAVHYGHVRYRDGDYYGREVNLAARVQAQSREGEVLVTGSVVNAAEGELRFQPLPDVPLRGFSQSTEIYRAYAGWRA